MFEMRYYDRKTGSQYTTGGATAFDCRETVLQYRYPSYTVDEGPGKYTTYWTEWIDVPTVREE